MQRVPLSIGVYDLSKDINKYAYNVSYEPRVGDNSGLMQDGTETEDILAWKAVITVTCNDLPDARVGQIVQLATDQFAPTIDVTYRDFRTYSVTQTGKFHVRLAPCTPTMYTRNGVVWWKGLSLTLREA